LLSRMGMQVHLALEDAPLVFPQPPLSGHSVCEALTGASGRFLPSATIRQNERSHPDVIFAVGDSTVENTEVPCWRLGSDDWNGILTLGADADARCFSGDWPIGAMASAALAAGEAFKFVMRRLPLENPNAEVFLKPCPSSVFRFSGLPVPKGCLDFGEVDIISGGAISQAALYALIRLPCVRLVGRIFDNDQTGPSNLNRNMLSATDDVGSQKVVVATRRCAPTLRLEGVPQRFPGRSSEFGKLASRVIVGVDDIPSRWEVQRRASRWLAVGGTSHFSISSSSHRAGEPCCGCLHPNDDPDVPGATPIPTVSFVSFWAGLVTAVRLIQEGLGVRCPPNRQQLWLTPLRMDLPFAAMWMPVARNKNCPIKCSSARSLAGP